MGITLTAKFYEKEDVVALAKELLGKFLMTCLDGKITGGKIIETESYKGAEDKACHAYQNRRTKRTEVMFANGGIAYVYLCYGIHSLFNVVTASEDIPHAILIRAIEPTDGIDIMLQRRKAPLSKLARGPGTLTRALGINTSHSGVSLYGNEIWIEDRGIAYSDGQILASPRVGVDYAGEHALLPWRFRILKK